MQPWHAPKCLMPINGVPILYHLLRHLGRFEQIKSITICVGYRAGDIVAAVHSFSEYATAGLAFPVLFSDEGEDAPMGKRILEAHKLFDDDARTLVLYGDELADVDVDKLVSRHEREHHLMTFAVAYQAHAGGLASWGFENVSIVEGYKFPVNIGFVVAEPPCWDYLHPDDGVSDWINRVAKKLSVGVHHHEGRRATVNTLADLERAEEVWK